jgi:hypothetical protein
MKARKQARLFVNKKKQNSFAHLAPGRFTGTVEN